MKKILIAALISILTIEYAYAEGKSDYEEALAWRNFVTSETRPVIGIAFGGGGARGMAHIGVLRSLLKSGIPIERVTGTSIGAFIGSLYSSGASIDSIEELALSTNWSNLIELKTSRISIFSTRRLEEFIEFHLQRLRRNSYDSNIIFETAVNYPKLNSSEIQFADLKMPFACAATELYSGSIILFDSGSVANAVRASCSIPGLFEPVQTDHQLLIDGGVLMNLPVSLCRKIGAENVIAVDVESDTTEKLSGLMDILSQIIKIQGYALTENERKLANAVIEPSVGAIKITELERADEAVRRGEIAGAAAAKKIRRNLLELNEDTEFFQITADDISGIENVIKQLRTQRNAGSILKTSELTSALALSSKLGLDREALALYRTAQPSDTLSLFSAELSSIRLKLSDQADTILQSLSAKQLPENYWWELAAAAVIANQNKIEEKILNRIKERRLDAD